MITWDDSYSIGVPEINEQHKHLFQLTNEAYDLLNDYATADKYDSILNLIVELKEYTVYHFSSEEEYMKKTGYKWYKEHKEEHTNFINTVESIDMNDIDMHQDEALTKIFDFVSKWIYDHILTFDITVSPNYQGIGL